MYPSQIKTNMRHRGPMESRKINQFQAETYANVQMLIKRLEVQQQTLSALWDSIRYGTADTAGEDDTHLRLQQISIRLEAIKGGVQNV